MLKYWNIVNKKTGEIVYIYESEKKQLFGGEWGREDLFDNVESSNPSPMPPPNKPFSTNDLAQVLVNKGVISKGDLPATAQQEAP